MSVVPLEIVVVVLLQGFTVGLELTEEETTLLRSGRFLEGETSK